MSEHEKAEPSYNERNIDEFRAHGGKLAAFGDAPVLLLSTVGAKSGLERIAPMMYMADERDPDRVYVFASRAGAESNPVWFNNLVAQPAVVVEIGEERLGAQAQVLEESERAIIYAQQAERYPRFGEYQEKTERLIPVVALLLDRS